MPRLSRQGFTFVELLIAISILAVIVAGIQEMFVMASVLGDVADNTTLAMIDAQSKLEEIRNTPYANIYDNYSNTGTPGHLFTPANLTGKGIIYMDNTNPDLLDVSVVVSFANKQGRVIGEDSNFNGVLDGGEDKDGDGKISSIVSLRTYVAKK